MRKTVLVVEDDFDTQHPLAEILRLRGYVVATASDAERGISTAHATQPDLIITDLLLPGQSGLHLIASVRNDEALKATPIIVISGCEAPKLAEAVRAGADCCLEKPIRFEQFWESIERLLGRRRQIEEVEPGAIAKEAGYARANQINDLVDQLRRCSTEEEKERILRMLKQQILGQSHESARA